MAGSESLRPPVLPPTHEAVEQRPWDFMMLQGQVGLIYEAHDRECDYGPDTMFAKLIGNGVTLKKAASKDNLDIEGVSRALTNVFIWTATVANTAHLPLFDVVLEKYLGGCPRCHHMPCNLAKGSPCERTNEYPEDFGRFSLDPSLNGFQEYFAHMYPNNYKNPREDIKNITGRVYDEIGELVSSTHADVEREQAPFSHFFSDRDQQFPYRGEIADVMAWSFATAEALDKITGNYKLGTVLKEKYESGCPYCKSIPCQCPKEETIIKMLSQWEPK